MATLKKCSKGLIASSACLSGKLDRLLLDGNFESACAHAREMESIFGKGHYFVEIMDHDLEDEKRVVPLLVQVSRETGIPCWRQMTATTSAAKTRTRRKCSCASRPARRSTIPTACAYDASCTSRAKRKCAKSFRIRRCHRAHRGSCQALSRRFRLRRNQAAPLPHRGGRNQRADVPPPV